MEKEHTIKCKACHKIKKVIDDEIISDATLYYNGYHRHNGNILCTRCYRAAMVPPKQTSVQQRLAILRDS